MTRVIKPTQRQLLETGSEATAQRGVIKWWATACEKFGLPENVLYHVPNGGSRDYVEACQLKLQGVRRGIPDLFLAVPRGHFHGLYIEMKRPNGGTLSSDQKEFLEGAKTRMYCAFACHGSEAAIELISRYLQGGGSELELSSSVLTFGDMECPFKEEK